MAAPVFGVYEGHWKSWRDHSCYKRFVSFFRAVVSALSRYADFRGRGSRADYWWFALFQVLVGAATGAMDVALGTVAGSGRTGLVSAIAALALLIPALAVAVRRLHDTGRSGWWLLLGLIPLIGPVVLLVFVLQEGDEMPNRFGHPPLARPQPEIRLLVDFSVAFVVTAAALLLFGVRLNAEGISNLGLLLACLAFGSFVVSVPFGAAAAIAENRERRSAAV